MKALVAVASRHGGTRGIAEAVGEELRAGGIDVDVRDVRDVHGIADYAAVILGSGVYMGKLMPEVWRFIEEHQGALTAVPVWLFSSGPLGAEDPKPLSDPVQLPDLLKATGARGHRIFGGALDRQALGVGERLVATVVAAPEGDFRDWNAIRGWAGGIAAAIAHP